MGPRGQQAHRMDFRTHVDDTVLSMKQEELDQQTAEDKTNEQAFDKLAEIAALADHPGWKQMQEMITNKAQEYRLLKPMEEIIVDANISNEAFGATARGCLWVAKELEGFIETVETAASVIETERQTRKAARKDQL